MIWSSAILGDLEIEQRHVEFIESGDHFDLKLTGERLTNCWMFLQNGRQHLHCDEGVRPLADWKLVVSAGETLTDPLPILYQSGQQRYHQVRYQCPQRVPLPRLPAYAGTASPGRERRRGENP